VKTDNLDDDDELSEDLDEDETMTDLNNLNMMFCSTASRICRINDIQHE
jgi:hypothetical protein